MSVDFIKNNDKLEHLLESGIVNVRLLKDDYKYKDNNTRNETIPPLPTSQDEIFVNNPNIPPYRDCLDNMTPDSRGRYWK